MGGWSHFFQNTPHSHIHIQCTVCGVVPRNTNTQRPQEGGQSDLIQGKEVAQWHHWGVQRGLQHEASWPGSWQRHLSLKNGLQLHLHRCQYWWALSDPWHQMGVLKINPIWRGSPYLGFQWNLWSRAVHLPDEKRLGTSQSLPSGGRNAHTISSKHKDCMESSCMQHWSSLLGMPTSPAWRWCLHLSITVLSAHTPLPRAPWMTWTGGSTSSARWLFPSPSPDPEPSQITGLTQMPAQASVLQSWLAPDGTHGSWSLDGNPKEGISNGPRQLASSYLPSVYVLFQAKESTSCSMVTTKALLKDGGKGGAQTSLPTMYSSESSNFRGLW